jgi:hypothetical protein
MGGGGESLKEHVGIAEENQNLLSLFKGTVSRDEYFWIAYKVSQYFLYLRWWFLKFGLSLMLRKSNAKFLLASLKTLTNFYNPSSNPLQRACLAFRYPPVPVNLATEPGCDSKNCSVHRP